MNTPVLETERLVLRKFMEDDLPELFDIYSDEDVNKYLPWFPLKSMEETKTFFEERYTPDYAKSEGYRYAICFKNDNVPIGYINVGTDESYDLGYGLRKEFWHQGIVREAGRAVVEQVKKMACRISQRHTMLTIPAAGMLCRLSGCVINIPMKKCGSRKIFLSHLECINLILTAMTGLYIKNSICFLGSRKS